MKIRLTVEELGEDGIAIYEGQMTIESDQNFLDIINRMANLQVSAVNLEDD